METISRPIQTSAFLLKDVKICAESKDEQFTALHVKHHLLGISDETSVLKIMDGIIEGVTARV